MRNFSTISTGKSVFVSYDVNCSEYENSVSITKVLEALAAALESDSNEVKQCFHYFILTGGIIGRLTPSEQRVVTQLADFHLLVSRQGDCLSGGESVCFSYCNLSTGASVIWSHVVL